MTPSAVAGATTTSAAAVTAATAERNVARLISASFVDCGPADHVPSEMTALIRSKRDVRAGIRLAHQELGSCLEDAEERLVDRDDRRAEVRAAAFPSRSISAAVLANPGRPSAELVDGQAGAVVLDEERLPCLGIRSGHDSTVGRSTRRGIGRSATSVRNDSGLGVERILLNHAVARAATVVNALPVWSREHCYRRRGAECSAGANPQPAYINFQDWERDS